MDRSRVLRIEGGKPQADGRENERSRCAGHLVSPSTWWRLALRGTEDEEKRRRDGTRADSFGSVFSPPVGRGEGWNPTWKGTGSDGLRLGVG